MCDPIVAHRNVKSFRQSNQGICYPNFHDMSLRHPWLNQLKALLFQTFELHFHSIPDIPGNGNRNGKLHSQNLGTGIENCIPNFWERQREWEAGIPGNGR